MNKERFMDIPNLGLQPVRQQHHQLPLSSVEMERPAVRVNQRSGQKAYLQALQRRDPEDHAA